MLLPKLELWLSRRSKHAFKRFSVAWPTAWRENMRLNWHPHTNLSTIPPEMCSNTTIPKSQGRAGLNGSHGSDQKGRCPYRVVLTYHRSSEIQWKSPDMWKSNFTWKPPHACKRADPSKAGSHKSYLQARCKLWLLTAGIERQLKTLCHSHYPLGRYCYAHLPFGISSTLEYFQKSMQMIVEGPWGVKC